MFRLLLKLFTTKPTPRVTVTIEPLPIKKQIAEDDYTVVRDVLKQLSA